MATHIGHSGFDFPIGILGPTEMISYRSYHNYHHVKNIGNYGSLLKIWDRIFGTCVPYERELEAALKEKKNK